MKVKIPILFILCFCTFPCISGQVIFKPKNATQTEKEDKIEVSRVAVYGKRTEVLLEFSTASAYGFSFKIFKPTHKKAFYLRHAEGESLLKSIRGVKPGKSFYISPSKTRKIELVFESLGSDVRSFDIIENCHEGCVSFYDIVIPIDGQILDDNMTINISDREKAISTICA
jgi:hypothetical protein